ncbi:MAG: hypothetical protein HY681_15165 [Chloroflexi bacterium]|nr:hypothetical protein [Chloroflexota bacterium]
MSASTRWLIGIAAGIALLVILSIAVALARGGEAPLLDEGKPEGIVQRFLLAVEDKEYVKAHGYLSARLQEGCPISHIREALRWREDNSRETRVEMVEQEAVEEGKTQVRVRVTEVNVSPPFGVDEFRHDELYVLVQEDGAWRIDEPPWPVGYCPNLVVPAKPVAIPLR